MTTTYRVIVVTEWEAFVAQWPLTEDGLRQPPCVLAGHQAGPTELVAQDDLYVKRLLPGERAVWGAMTPDQRQTLLAMDGVAIYTDRAEAEAACPAIDFTLLHGFMGQ